MEQLLLRYLTVTGILAAIALAAPGLVVLGLFLGVLPGLVLGLAPTAFLWGALFTVVWWPAHGVVGDGPAAVLALAATYAVIRGVPARLDRPLTARLAALRADDVAPAERIALRGVVAFELAHPHEQPSKDQLRPWDDRVARERPRAIDPLCAAALFTPGVDAVVRVALPHPDHADRSAPLAAPETYRVVRRSAGSPSVLPADLGTHGAWYGGWEPTTAQPLADEWRLRVARGETIVRDDGDGGPADFTVTVRDWREDAVARRGRWTLPPGPMSARRVEVRDRVGAVLLRRTVVTAPLRGPLLSVAGRGAPESYRFGWGTSTPRGARRTEELKAVALLREWTTLRLDADPREAAVAARGELARLLADRTRPVTDPAFALVRPVLRDVGEQGPVPGDAALLATLLADPRLRDYEGLGRAVRRLGAEGALLRDVMVRRVLAGRFPGDVHLGALGHALRELPPGTFATLTPWEETLLADPERRLWARGLIERQSDRGAAAVPLLLDVLAQAYAILADRGDRRHDVARTAADAARRALMVLGPAAAAALPALDRMAAEAIVPRHVTEAESWKFLLARLGRPVERFAKPANRGGTVEQYHARMRRDLERFDPNGNW